MSDLAKPTAVERVSGNVLTESALTVFVAIAGGPLAALLPVLGKSLAAERQRKRVEKALSDLATDLEQHQEQIQNLTDEQYKVINETVFALLQTTHEDKLDYLRAVISNTLQSKDIKSEEAIILSRVVRDISAEEAAFVLRTFRFDGIHLMAAQEGQEFTDNILRIDPSSREALIVSGLLSLGLLSPAEPTWDAPNVLRFTGVVAKLIALLRKPDAYPTAPRGAAR